MAESTDISTFDGISNARQEIFRGLLSGEVSEQRVNIAERVLRGQQSLKEFPAKLLNMITRMKVAGNEQAVTALVDRVLASLGTRALKR